MIDYFILGCARDDKYCKVDRSPDHLPSLVPAKRGQSMSHLWPEGAEFRMARRHPGLMVPDVVFNPHRCLMVTARMKSFLDENIPSPVEFLPFVLVNHKGRVADDSMWIVNLLDTVECADMVKTRGSESAFDPGEISRLLELHVLEDKLPTDRKIFRIKECPHTILVDGGLRRSMAEAGFSAGYHNLAETIY